MIGHLPALRRYALALAGDRQSADDLVQDCIERALRRIDTLADEQKMAGWLRSILFNVFIDGRRAFRRRGATVEAEVLDELVDTATPPDLLQETADVLRAIAVLTPQHRQVLVLVAVEGLSYQEVAEELAVPVGTVMSRLARARDHLRDALAERPAALAAPAPRKRER
jgi:RNA polymerase sigma-70 factor (ECF subfamily)